jgi:hypothetical protein
MIMSVFTRIREIAILRVNGLSNRQVAGMIFWRISASGACRCGSGPVNRPGRDLRPQVCSGPTWLRRFWAFLKPAADFRVWWASNPYAKFMAM